MGNSERASYEFKSLFRGGITSYLVGFYLFSFYLELHFRLSILQSFRFQFVYGALVGIICLYKFINGRNVNTEIYSMTRTAAVLIFLMLLYTIFSLDRETSTRIFIDRVLKFSLVAFFIYAAVEKVEDLRVILACIILAWLKIGQEGVWGWYTGNLVWENQGIPRLHGSTAMYVHPNSFSGFAVGCLPFCIFLYMGIKNKITRLGLLALFVSSLIIIISTGSRTGYVATLLGSVYFFKTFKAGKVKTLIFCLVAGLLVINVVPEHYKERFFSIFSGEEKEGRSSEKRMEIIKDAFVIYGKYPLGVGVAAFPAVREEVFGRSQDTHNLYLEVLTNIGPIGLILFSVFIYKMININRKNISKLHKVEEDKLGETQILKNLSKAIIGFIILRLLLGLFGMDLYEIYWWIALGLTLAVTKLLAREKPSAVS